jgi:tetratricopeptide (TPR) repeat protein
VANGQDTTAGRSGGIPAAGLGGQHPGSRVRVSRQLPLPARHFVGRDEPIKELDELLDRVTADGGRPGPASQESSVIAAISGTAGVGKTTLALHWAHHVADRFPDGQLYVNLRGYDPSGTPVEPADAMRNLLEALGVSAERVPPTTEARLGLLRSSLAGQRMLILLDNARDADQVRPLLAAAPGCLTVITSRSQLTGLEAPGGDGAQLISLDVLTETEATQLLQRQLGTERLSAQQDAVTGLTQLCARLPLALAIIAARAAARSDLPLAELVTELQGDHGVLEAHGVLETLDDGHRDTSIKAVFSWSVRQVSDQAARMFRLLGLHPGPDISRQAAASLAGLATGEAVRLLAELTDAHLLAEVAPGRFGFHDLLRAYAAEEAEEHFGQDELEAARLRALDHYLQTGFAAVLLLQPHRTRITISPPQPGVRTEPLAGYQQALAWLEAEYQVILAAVALADSRGYDEYSWRLAWTLADFLDWRGHWQNWVSTQQVALAACRRLDHLTGQAIVHRSLARACYRLGRYDETGTHQRTALDLYRQIGDPLGQARCHTDMASALERDTRYAEAIDHAEQALQLFRAASHPAGEANALNTLGWCHALAGHHALALDYCQQAADLQHQIGDRHAEAASLDSVGFAHHHLGQYEEAIACFRRALGFYTEIGNRQSQAEVLDHLAETQHAYGRPAEARDAWRQALTIMEDLHHQDTERIRARLIRPPGPV